MATDPFLGTWHLLPEQSDYQLGEPPRRGLYQIQTQGDGYLITMKWETAAGQSHQMSYEATPDGIHHPYEDPEVADSVSMTRVDERTLDSETRKGGKVAAHARRLLSEDGQTMTVTQSGPLPDGAQFRNVSVYSREQGDN